MGGSLDSLAANFYTRFRFKRLLSTRECVCVCVFVCLFVCVCMCEYYTYIYIYIVVHIYIYMYTCMYVYTYVVYARYMVPSHHISNITNPTDLSSEVKRPDMILPEKAFEIHQDRFMPDIDSLRSRRQDRRTSCRRRRQTLDAHPASR